MLTKLGITLVVDHMGRPATAEGVAAQAFQELLLLVADGAFWVKLALCRASTQFPDYPDARPFHDAFLAANPDRLVWGSDWPHIRLSDRAPDVGHLLDLFDEWIAGDEGLRRKILVANPETLFGF
jgi:predicted TIM-barrel fold metal-dependent hydrolase